MRKSGRRSKRKSRRRSKRRSPVSMNMMRTILFEEKYDRPGRHEPDFHIDKIVSSYHTYGPNDFDKVLNLVSQGEWDDEYIKSINSLKKLKEVLLLSYKVNNRNAKRELLSRIGIDDLDGQIVIQHLIDKGYYDRILFNKIRESTSKEFLLSIMGNEHVRKDLIPLYGVNDFFLFCIEYSYYAYLQTLLKYHRRSLSSRTMERGLSDARRSGDNRLVSILLKYK